MDAQRETNEVFLALDMWREASNQPPDARAAVGQSVLARVRHPAWWGDDIQSVIFKRLQYSSLTAPGDPNLIRWPLSTDQSWWECLATAQALLDGTAPNPCAGADSYHDVSIPPPYWAKTARRVGQVGDLIFYYTGHDWEADQLPPQVGGVQ